MPDKKILIAPSVLSADFTRLGDELESIKDADLVHYDVMDGHFVPNLSFGTEILRQARRATDLPLDVHLMVSNPEEQVPWYLDSGADIVTFHYEAQTHANRIVSQIHEAGAKACMALNPATPVALLDSIIEDLDMVLVMTVNPGFGGQSFIPSSLSKLRALRRLCHEHGVAPDVEVDGGIGPDNIAEVAAAGANVFVAGSKVFNAKDRSAAIGALRANATLGTTKRA
ncbi:MAG: ribulose-phosphate 3-epimerase [Parafannyhessea sp.]|uniref:ribulose-phosphate 3-epimerase n=1 Tax=Parafannyhessea sp. TaxID=2847324 RepID=UPI003F059BFC